MSPQREQDSLPEVLSQSWTITLKQQNSPQPDSVSRLALFQCTPSPCHRPRLLTMTSDAEPRLTPDNSTLDHRLTPDAEQTNSILF